MRAAAKQAQHRTEELFDSQGEKRQAHNDGDQMPSRASTKKICTTSPVAARSDDRYRAIDERIHRLEMFHRDYVEDIERALIRIKQQVDQLLEQSTPWELVQLRLAVRAMHCELLEAVKGSAVLNPNTSEVHDADVGVKCERDEASKR
ncbi:hypothetical protein NEOLEDRAFT_1151433 [Neolentinus lepideus HHB14362 ss-1]|uniref:Uncharacterized protein n=1 Tax=Neolentinus lepideus HHB14362 ss-1 TaxID=1314782 RepID=A0A165NZV2_9AGAM|nr:hypothetical protein NEOLEDRAFT_1151433 [Neolentinus lepideus HHB14362 ss-1]